MSVCRLSRFDDERLLSFISCLQITHDAIYFAYKPHAGGAWEIAHHAHIHDIGVHDPPDVEVFQDVGDDMEDGFADGWEDEDSEEEELVGIGAMEDDSQ